MCYLQSRYLNLSVTAKLPTNTRGGNEQRLIESECDQDTSVELCNELCKELYSHQHTWVTHVCAAQWNPTKETQTSMLHSPRSTPQSAGRHGNLIRMSHRRSSTGGASEGWGGGMRGMGVQPHLPDLNVSPLLWTTRPPHE